MKTQFLSFALTLLCISLAFRTQAQCDLSKLAVVINSTALSGENCTVDVTVSFTIEKNKGNKYTYVHLWTPGNYPRLDYKKAPDKADLINALGTLAIHTDGTASLLPTYGPDNTVPTLYDGLTINEESLGDGLYSITISNIMLVVPGACDNVKSLKADIWSTQSEAGKHPPVHCSSTTVLPVKLVKFKGDLMDNAIALSWTTTEETGSSHFDIERSSDSREFLSLGSVKSNGTTRADQHYNFVDRNPLPGNNYYRLKMVDLDGTSEKSSIVAVENNAGSVAFELLGNPVSGNEIRFLLKNADTQKIRLYELNGKRLDFTLQGAGNTYTLKPGTRLHSGIYILGIGAESKKVLIP